VSTLFISDLHLDAARPDCMHAFLNFLQLHALNAESLYILGDFFEAWVGDDEDSALANTVRAALRKVSAAGVRVYFMRGNRDFLVGSRFAGDCGLSLLPDHAVISLYGEPVLLMHGDLLCTDDTAYQQFRQQVRSAAWQTQFLSQPLAARKAFAEQARAASKQHQQNQMAVSESIMDVNAQAVIDTMALYGVRKLIHGHTHRPAVHSLSVKNQAANRIVLGDWYEQGSMLKVTANGFELHGFDF
jgi:UDP-2,3-diacylglucosamine hydrolase